VSLLKDGQWDTVPAFSLPPLPTYRGRHQTVDKMNVDPNAYPGINPVTPRSFPSSPVMMAPEEIYKHLTLSIEQALKERELVSETAMALEGQLIEAKSLGQSLTKNIEVMTQARDQIATLLPSTVDEDGPYRG
jgi:hypothetical protein